MRTVLAITIAILFFTTYSGIHLGADAIVNIPINISGGASANVGLTLAGSQSAYQIEIEKTGNGFRNIVRIHVVRFDKQPFKLIESTVTATVPRSAIQGIWYPSAPASSHEIMASDSSHALDGIADADYGIPYIASASSNLANVFAMGLGRQDLPVAITGRPNGGTYQFQLSVLAERTAASFDESFYISTDPSQNWFDTAADYANWVDGINNYQPLPISNRAYEPLYDAWYWAKDRVDDRLYLETAQLAAEAGFGTYLADAGWDTAAGEYEKWLNGRTGDYDPPPDKFNDLPATFDTIRSGDGLGISLWLQPFAIGRASARYSQTRDMHIHVPSGTKSGLGWLGLTYPPFALPSGRDLETVNLCPRHAPTQAYLKNLFGEMAAKYRPEGYWIDFIDGVSTYCSATHSHDDALFGDGLRTALDGIKNTILENNPDAVIQFRAKYANLNTKPFANVWQTEDSPGDFEGMRLNSIRLRPFSRGVVFAADQMYWPKTTSEETVAKFIATSVMIGTPAFGPDLLAAPPSTLDMLKSWLAFYRAHRDELANGRFSIFGQLKVPNQIVEAPDATFVYLRNLDFSELPVGGRTIYLINAMDSDDVAVRVRAGTGVYVVKVLDRYLAEGSDELRLETSPDGFIDIELPVQQGGMIVLSKTDGTEVSSLAFLTH